LARDHRQPLALASANATPNPSTRDPSARRDTPMYAFAM